MTTRERPPTVLVLFGATGDLASRSLHPALYRLAERGELPASFALVGSGRHAPDEDRESDLDGAYRDLVEHDVRESVEEVDADVLGSLMRRCTFRTADSDDAVALVDHIRDLTSDDAQVVTYFSVPPEAVRAMVGALDEAGVMADARLVQEKPFGLDPRSAAGLVDALHEMVPEDRTFRVDHYLAGTSAQDLLLGADDPDGRWDAEHVDEIQIDVPETLLLEGRGSFYEDTGCLRDMVVDHLLGLVSVLVADRPDGMDRTGLGERQVRDARLRALQQVRPIQPVETRFGQYQGYRDDDDVDDASDVETFVATRLHVDGRTWQGVPFLLRTGKGLAQATPTLTVRTVGGVDRHVGIGTDGAYEQVLRDVLDGDRTRFVRDDEVLRRWDLVADLLASPPPAEPYPIGSWGPAEALTLPSRGWHLR